VVCWQTVLISWYTSWWNWCISECLSLSFSLWVAPILSRRFRRDLIFIIHHKLPTVLLIQSTELQWMEQEFISAVWATARARVCVCVCVCVCGSVMFARNNATRVMKPDPLDRIQFPPTVVPCVTVRTIRYLYDNSHLPQWYVCATRATEAVPGNSIKHSNSLPSLQPDELFPFVVALRWEHLMWFNMSVCVTSTGYFFILLWLAIRKYRYSVSYELMRCPSLAVV